MSNAVKFTNEGGRVTIDFGPVRRVDGALVPIDPAEAGPSDFLKVSVHDNELSGGARDTTQARLSNGGRHGGFTYAFTGKYKRQQGPMEFQKNSIFENGDGYLNASYKGFGLSYLLHGDSFGSFGFGSRTPIPTLPTGQTLHLKPEHITTVEAGAEYFITGAYSVKLDAFYSSIGDYIEAEDFTLRVGGVGQPPRPAAIGPRGLARLALATNRTTPIRTKGGEIEVRPRPFNGLTGIVSYAYETHNLNDLLDSQAGYVPKHKVTAMVTFAPVERLSLNFDRNTVSRFNTASPGQTLGATSSILFGEHIGEPYEIANANVRYRLLSRGKSSLTVAFQVRNLFNEKVQQTPVPAVDVSLRGREPFLQVAYKF